MSKQNMTSLIVIVLLLAGWDFGWYLAGVKPLFPWQLKKLLENKRDAISLIDVRTRWEFNWFHINGAANRPDLLYDLEALPAKSKDAPAIVICMTGHRSPLVAYRLKKRGFKRVYNLTWGMLAWKLSGMSNDK